MNETTKSKLPGYLDEFNWSKLHQEANPGDKFCYVFPHNRDPGTDPRISQSGDCTVL